MDDNESPVLPEEKNEQVHRAQESDLQQAKQTVAKTLVYGGDDKELVDDLADLYCETNSSMRVFPDKIGFETQETDEKIILILRQAFVTNWRWMGLAFVMVWAPFFLSFLQIFPAWLPGRYLVLISVFWELLVVGYIFESFLKWYYNISMVTDRRVVDIDFNSLLSRKMSDADLDRIQDVTFKSEGVMAAIFHYGDILVQTAAEITEFEFTAVDKPEKVASVIRALAQKYNK